MATSATSTTSFRILNTAQPYCAALLRSGRRGNLHYDDFSGKRRCGRTRLLQGFEGKLSAFRVVSLTSKRLSIMYEHRTSVDWEMYLKPGNRSKA